jgi:hypothetical protein
LFCSNIVDFIFQVIAHLWKLGYAAEDIIGNIFRVTKSMQMSEELKLNFIKVDNWKYVALACAMCLGYVSAVLQSHWSLFSATLIKILSC